MASAVEQTARRAEAFCKVARMRSEEAAKALVKGELQARTEHDVAAMNEVADRELDDKAWVSLKDDVPEERVEKVKGEIADRIKEGEKQIAAQSLDF